MDPARRFRQVVASVVLALALAIVLVIRYAQPRALEVVAVSPADGATAVARTEGVTVTFSRPVDETTVRRGFTVTPETDGFIGVAGRRAAFTPKTGFRAGTTYTVTLRADVRDLGGRTLGRDFRVRFQIRPLALVLHAPDGRLVRAPLVGEPEPVAPAPVAAFAVSDAGTIAYVSAGESRLVVTASPAPREVVLPAGFQVRDLAWAPGGRALLLFGESASAPGFLIVRLDAGGATIEPLGPQAGLAGRAAPPPEEAGPRRLAADRETFAFTPDGESVIVRAPDGPFVVVGLDGRWRRTLGPFVAVGDVAPRGDSLLVVGADPAEPRRRQVLLYRLDAPLRRLSDPERDSHSPTFAHEGAHAAFVAALEPGIAPGRRYAVVVVDLATGRRRRLTDPPAGQSDEAPRWSPDDTWLSFRRSPVGAPAEGRIGVVSLAGGPARPLGPPAHDARWLP